MAAPAPPGEWFRADEALLRYARGQAAGPAPPTPAEAARAAELRRVLAALDPAVLAAAGMG